MIIAKNRLGRTVEVNDEFVKYQTMIKGDEQVVPRKNIVSFKLGRSIYDIWGFEKTVTFWTADGKKHVIKYLKKALAKEILRTLDGSGQ